MWWKKIIGYTLLTLVCVAGAGFAYLYFRKPASQPPSKLRVVMTPERIARGKYVYALADCDNCHSPHDPTKMYLPVIEEKRASGQYLPEEKFPGKLYIPNITPDPETGIGKWTDGEKIRAIREGIGRDGSALFPMMPYEHFRYMSDDDVQALVAYLNSLKPVHNPQPKLTLNFPLPLLIKGAPQPVLQPVATPSRTNPITHGEYLVTLGVCEECHTSDAGASKRLAGGRTFNIMGYSVTSANITPDRKTGIGDWSLDYFLNRFRRHRGQSAEVLPAATKEQFTIMPWRSLSELPDEDLAMIYGYLMTQRPVENRVVTHAVNVAQR